MKTQRSKEGYLLIENRHAPGPTEAMVDAMRAAGHTEFINPSEPVFESATITCSHCNQILIRNPIRSRPRAYCAKCDHYICDPCEFLAQKQPCMTMTQKVDIVQNAVSKGLILTHG